MASLEADFPETSAGSSSPSKVTVSVPPFKSNAPTPMDLTAGLMVILLRAVPLKAFAPIVVTFSPRFKVLKFPHPLNASYPIISNESGRFTAVIPG